MGRILYIGDWHYGDADIIDYDDRPFADVAAMNDSLVGNWNGAVGDDDTVYVLGDMFACPVDEAVRVLSGLKGRKVLVTGNHDAWDERPVEVGLPDGRKAFRTFTAMFEHVGPYLEARDGDTRTVLCHYPIPCFRDGYFGSVHLYAHVHAGFEAGMTERSRRLMERLYGKPWNMVNVGAMMPWMGYTPRTLAHILSGYAMHVGGLRYAADGIDTVRPGTG